MNVSVIGKITPLSLGLWLEITRGGTKSLFCKSQVSLESLHSILFSSQVPSQDKQVPSQVPSQNRQVQVELQVLNF